ncbi:MAG: magnesium transporter CorA family protein [Candidatus Saccharimonadales bacterium]
MIQYYFRAPGDSKAKTLSAFKTGAWVYAEDPTNAEIAQLLGLGLDEGLIEDALDADEVPRFEIEDGITYLFTRFAYKNSGGKVVTAPVTIALSSTFILTISAVANPKLKQFAEKGDDNITTRRSELLLEILELLLESYSVQLNGINKQIRAARNSLNVRRVSNKDFVQFVEIEDVLNEFLGDLVPANSVLQSLTGRRKNLSFDEEDRDLIEDLQLSATQLIDTIRGSLKTAVNIREAYTNIATNNLNRQVKILTTLTVVLTMPTIIGSFWGMNVNVPFHNNAHAFIFILLGSAGVAGLILAIFRKNGWL